VTLNRDAGARILILLYNGSRNPGIIPR